MWEEPDRRFGARFAKAMLPAEYARLTLYRVRKLMREMGIRGCTPRKNKRTTIGYRIPAEAMDAFFERTAPIEKKPTAAA